MGSHLLFEPTEILGARSVGPSPLHETHSVLRRAFTQRKMEIRSRRLRPTSHEEFGSVTSRISGPPSQLNSAYATDAEIDVLEYDKCAGQLRFIAIILGRAVTPRILTHLGSHRVRPLFGAAGANCSLRRLLRFRFSGSAGAPGRQDQRSRQTATIPGLPGGC